MGDLQLPVVSRYGLYSGANRGEGGAAMSHAVKPTCIVHVKRNSAIAEGPRDAPCQLKSCQLTRNSAETTCTTSPEQIEVMKLEGYSGAMCNKHMHSTMTRSSRFHCPIGVINKPTTDELWISPVYRRLALAKASRGKNYKLRCMHFRPECPNYIYIIFYRIVLFCIVV